MQCKPVIQGDFQYARVVLFFGCGIFCCIFKQIVINAGFAEAGVFLGDIRKGKGFDAYRVEIIPDMIASGIIDPVKVVRSGLENSASAAAILLTTEVALTDLPEKKEKGVPETDY